MFRLSVASDRRRCRGTRHWRDWRSLEDSRRSEARIEEKRRPSTPGVCNVVVTQSLQMALLSFRFRFCPASQRRTNLRTGNKKTTWRSSLSLYAYNFNVYLLFHQLLGKMRRFRFFLFFVVVLFAGYNQRPEMERIHLIKEEYSQHGASGYTMEMT